jgi:16S rRNA (cytosine967-C5)-methyltransferase
MAGGNIDLLAVDSDADRLTQVAGNLERLRRHARLACLDLRDTRSLEGEAPFDRILIDAPCSATGVIRRHPDIKFLRRATDMPALAARQAQMLEKLWPLLRPGGQLLYSTCSLFRCENSTVVSNFLGTHPDARELPLADELPGAVADQGPGRQLMPGTTDTDGFYYALMAHVPG